MIPSSPNCENTLNSASRNEAIELATRIFWINGCAARILSASSSLRNSPSSRWSRAALVKRNIIGSGCGDGLLAEPDRQIAAEQLFEFANVGAITFEEPMLRFEIALRCRSSARIQSHQSIDNRPP